MAMTRRKKKKIVRIILLILAVLFLLAIIIISPTAVKVFKLQKQAKELVASSSKSTFMESKTTIIYDTNGLELCTMRNNKDLYYIEFKDIPSEIIKAFISMEDKEFYSHTGIDTKAILRAVLANQKSNSIEQGASTITQQLARNIFLSHEVTWERKIKEMFIAIELEKKYSKEDILEFYLNNIYFANGYYGIEAAARGYFNKSIGELTLSQYAFLAVIPNSPSKYDPIANYDNTLNRRDLILRVMYDSGKINSMHYYTAIDEAVIINQTKRIKNNYVETYVRRCATESLMQADGFTFRYNFEGDSDYSAYCDLYDYYYSVCQQKLLSGGYSIYTSIDLDIQNQLQSAIDNNLSSFTEVNEEGIYALQGAGTCIDNNTGNVVAVVGGRSQDLNGYTLNRAYQSYRQPGSAIKPLNVYIPYLQLGNTPESRVLDTPFEGGPSNADGTYAGEISLRDAVKYSKNTVAWRIYEEMTPRTGSTFLMRLGFKKIFQDKDYISGALGGFTNGVTTEEMAGGYCAIQNDGVYRRPTCILYIYDAVNSRIVDETLRGALVYDANACTMMTDMLKTVVESGTGRAANIDNAVVAGKTGTTNSNKDSWFVGYSKYYTTSVWMGYDMPREIKSPSLYTCGIWKEFMEGLHTNLAKVDFAEYINTDNSEKENITEKQTEPYEYESAYQKEQGNETESITQSTQGASNNNQSNNEGNNQNNNTQTTSRPSEQNDIDVDISNMGDQDANISGGDEDAR